MAAYVGGVESEMPDVRHIPRAYFACSISAGRHFAANYPPIVNALSRHCLVLTNCYASPSFAGDAGLSPPQINERDLDQILESDLLVAEVSVTSLGVGYEIAKAESQRKPVLCLYRETNGPPSPMITGAQAVTAVPYDDPASLDGVFAAFVAENFFL